MTNSLYTNDNLYIMHGMNSESVDLIYLDPPFNTNRNFSAPIGSKAAGTAFKDMWTWQDVDEFCLDGLVEVAGLIDYIQSIGNIHGKPMMAYTTYMAQRIIQMHRVLKSTGSIYLHCDPYASHYLKPLLDVIFGKNNFRNEIIWKKYTGRKNNATRKFHTQHECIFLYAKSDEALFVPQYLPMTKKEIAKYNKTDDDGRRYAYVWGRTFQLTGDKGKKYLDERKGRLIGNLWVEDDLQLNTSTDEDLGYETQKPLALLHRIIKSSSNEGDIVFDPFCGCATTCVAAQQLGRQWIGIDIEASAPALLIERLSDDAGMFSDFVHLTKPPVRTDVVAVEPSLPVKKTLYQAQNGQCLGCKNEYLMKDLDIDHIQPKSKGGGNYIENYQLLCGHCNSVKGNRPMEWLRMKNQHIQSLLKNRVTFGE